ncbi:hypothetical protein MUK42_13305 [Musa troglodytarum]|uniref:Uncharacterized protein n=1 Tax=Musa troglodytarum TaxID=320322 RepID=A0A9E7H9V7_9LILI|nr:hypothetical protein MUK42_13305 [Musa troglodytarum]
MSTGQYGNHHCSLGNVTRGPVQKLLLGSYWIHFSLLPLLLRPLWPFAFGLCFQWS